MHINLENGSRDGDFWMVLVTSEKGDLEGLYGWTGSRECGKYQLRKLRITVSYRTCTSALPPPAPIQSCHNNIALQLNHAHNLTVPFLVPTATQHTVLTHCCTAQHTAQHSDQVYKTIVSSSPPPVLLHNTTLHYTTLHHPSIHTQHGLRGTAQLARMGPQSIRWPKPPRTWLPHRLVALVSQTTNVSVA